MTISRINTPSDATWQRAWEVADAAELATLLATYLTPLGPKRGDIIVQLDDGIYWFVVTTNVVQRLNGLAVIPVDLASEVTGLLPTDEVDEAWVDIPFDAGDFTGDGTITWTVASGDVTDFSYQILNRRTTVLNIRVENTTVAGTGQQLIIEVPAAIVPVKDIALIALVADAGSLESGFLSMSAGSPFISFFRPGTANWSASTDQSSVYTVLVYEITP